MENKHAAELQKTVDLLTKQLHKHTGEEVMISWAMTRGRQVMTGISVSEKLPWETASKMSVLSTGMLNKIYNSHS